MACAGTLLHYTELPNSQEFRFVQASNGFVAWFRHRSIYEYLTIEQRSNSLTIFNRRRTENLQLFLAKNTTMSEVDTGAPVSTLLDKNILEPMLLSKTGRPSIFVFRRYLVSFRLFDVEHFCCSRPNGRSTTHTSVRSILTKTTRPARSDFATFLVPICAPSTVHGLRFSLLSSYGSPYRRCFQRSKNHLV